MDTDIMDTKETMMNDEWWMTKWTIFPFAKILTWYEKNGRHDLPWRKIYDTPVKERLYKVWIAEVMLQQTQVDRVIGYYTRFLEKYPTIESLAETTYDELFPYYQGLWYYGRARRMIELAKVIVEKYDGVFPDDFEKLRKLPWIGQYTAQALLAFGYNQNVLAMDANLVKIFARYYFGNRSEPLPKKLIEDLEKQLKKINNWTLKTEHWRLINNALMDFGALVSTSIEKLDRERYPLTDCLWFTTEGKIEIKKPKTKNQRLKTRYACLVFLHEAHKIYWSSLSSHFEPFLIEPTSKDDRRTVQDYFSATFSLEVSVRPSFGSGIFEWILVKLFHAQIQTGTLKQKTFSKKEKEEWITEKLIRNW
jgi:A/G-specific adenine glycosylase